MAALGAYGALDDLLAKKMDYLHSLGKKDEVMKIVEDYKYLPSVASRWVDELMQQGRDDEADCALVCDLIVEEKQYACLLKILKQNRMSFKRTELFKKYAPYMSQDDQKAFTDMVIEELKQRLQYAKSGNYGYIVGELRQLSDACKEAKQLVSVFLAEIMLKYWNRPALMRLLAECLS